MDAQPWQGDTRPDTVGFIGLGNLGTPIAERLLAAGTPLIVHECGSRR